MDNHNHHNHHQNHNNNSHSNLHNAMDDTTMIRYLLGKYGMTDLVAMLRSAAASGERVSFPWRSPRRRLI